MSTRPKVFLVLFSLLILSVKIYSSSPYCQNLGFEMQDFTNWVGYTWAKGQRPDIVVSTPKVQEIVSPRQTIITENGYDPVIGNNKLKLIPDGFDVSCRLGSTYLGNGGLRQSLTYKLDVTPNNSFVIYYFAVVLQDPYDKDHAVEDEPRFTVTILDERDSVIKDCANYDVHATAATINGFQSITYTAYVLGQWMTTPVYWRDWTAVGIDLTKYIGQSIKLEFMSANCTRRGHFGYAYFTAKCMPMQISVGYCKDDTQAILYAPAGFSKYRWKDNGVVIDTTSTLKINNPEEGKVYQCELTSETGCVVTLDAVIKKYDTKAAFTKSYNCQTGSYSFQNNSYGTNGELRYLWDFGDGTNSTEISPNHIYNDIELKKITLKVDNLPSTCSDFVVDSVYAFNPNLVKITGDSVFCDVNSIKLTAHGAYTYKWSTGETGNSITVTTPGKYWVIGYSKEGDCASAPFYYNVTNRKVWDFDLRASHPNFCEDSYLMLYASSPYKPLKYKWNTGEIGDSIKITKGGTYSVTATFAENCNEQKTKSITLNEYKKPANIQVNWNISDCKNNVVLFSTNPALDNTYTLKWNFGDGNSGTGLSPHHKYTSSGNYNVSVEITNANGCSNTFGAMINPDFSRAVTISGPKQFCKGDSIILTASGAVTYQWSTGETTPSIKVKNQGNYSVVGYSTMNCSSDAVYHNVIFYPDWTLSIQGATYLCTGDNITLTASGAAQYYWNTGETTSQIKVTKGGTYTVTGTNENGCRQTKSFDVKEIKLPNTKFTLSDKLINMRKPVVTVSIPQEENIFYTWDFGDGSALQTGNTASHTYGLDNTTFKYIITLKAENTVYGCTKDSTMSVKVFLFIPNVFTPNSDGFNDKFMPNVDLTIRDRYGNIMYEGKDGWDGNYKGSKAVDDTYYYFIRYKDAEGKDEIIKGYIMLKR